MGPTFSSQFNNMNKRLLVLFILLSQFSLAQEKKPPFATIEPGQNVPKEVINSTRQLRERLLADPYRPAYHFVFPEGNGRPGDPNGAFYHNGRYHLMFLYNREGSGFCWGHVSSTDLLHWRYHPDAIMPGNGDEGCFSGGAFVDDDGSATLSYWMLWGDKGIGLAKSTDAHFDQWVKSSSNPVVKSSEWGITDMTDAAGRKFHVGSADPSNIWKKDGKYYMLTGNLLVLRKYGSRGEGLPADPGRDAQPLPADSLNYQGDRLYLFSSTDMKRWEYMHEFYQNNRKWTFKTEDNMCPSFLPLPSGPDGGAPSGKHLLLFISHNLGAQYYVGDYKDNRFFPSNHGRMTWKDNAYFAPEALVDNKGRQIMWSWIFDDRPDSLIDFSGWTGMYGLPRSLWVGDDGTLRMRPVKELEKLRGPESIESSVNIPADKEVGLKPGEELMEMEFTFNETKALQYGVKLGVSADGREETVIYYDASDKKLKVDTRKSGLGFGRKIIEEAPFELKKGEPLVLRVFMDKSIIEVFANDRQAIARMVYPTLGGRGVKVFSKGGSTRIDMVKRWSITPSNPF